MTHTQRYELVDPRLIQPNPWNTNVVSHENEVKLRASIERNGMFKPVLIRELADGTLQSLGGWHRAEQAVEIGMPQIPAIILSGLSDPAAKEISLADNARYGIDDTLKLSELLGQLDVAAVEEIMPWSHGDIVALTASLSVNVDDLDLDAPTLPTDDDQDKDPLPPKAAKTHQVMRFRVAIADAAAIGAKVQATQVQEGFNTADDLTNAGDALAFLLLDGGSNDDEDEADDAAA
jgi:ParB-like chromosome segregation protein Spo0J